MSDDKIIRPDMISSPLFIVIMGSPGAGKGTQAERLSKKHSIPHISSGELLRQTAKEKSPPGKRLKECMDRGELAPNDVIIDIMAERLGKNDCKKGFIIDGFPRARVEAIALEEILEHQGRKLGNVIEIKISREECLRRLAGRGRHDDKDDVINRRYDIYLEQSGEVRKYFKTRENLYKEINGENSEEFIEDALNGLVNIIDVKCEM
jgi:adenylate kinase